MPVAGASAEVEFIGRVARRHAAVDDTEHEVEKRPYELRRRRRGGRERHQIATDTDVLSFESTPKHAQAAFEDGAEIGLDAGVMLRPHQSHEVVHERVHGLRRFETLPDTVPATAARGGFVERQLKQHCQALQWVAQVVREHAGHPAQGSELGLKFGGRRVRGHARAGFVPRRASHAREGRRTIGDVSTARRVAGAVRGSTYAERGERASDAGGGWPRPVECAAVRGIRQHVNPFGLAYLEARARPSRLAAIHPRPLRVEVELGCADGDFSFGLAEREPSWHVVGLDIREPMIVRNTNKAARVGLSNVEFAYCNLNVDLDRVFAPASVDRFHLLFPDPWVKPRHRKRRVIAPELCRVIAKQLRPGGELHVATDVFDVALEILSELEAPATAALGFRNVAGSWSFSRQAPLPVLSRREVITRRRGQRVWRLRYGVG